MIVPWLILSVNYIAWLNVKDYACTLDHTTPIMEYTFKINVIMYYGRVKTGVILTFVK